MKTIKQIAALFLLPVALVLTSLEGWNEFKRYKSGDGGSTWDEQ